MNKSGIISILGYLYLTLPILIFFIGWCNLPTAIFGVIVLCISFYFTVKQAPSLWLPNDKKQILFLSLVFFIALLWVYSSGIGALVFQNFDHNCRNPIFELLVSKSWPVVHSTESAILTYYIGFWLPSAIVGKIFNSITIGYYCQVLWATIGIFLFFYLILANLRKKNLIPIVIIILFSGLDILGAFLITGPPVLSSFTSHLEWWFPDFQFSSMTTQLFWVFNQAIPAWVFVMLCYNEKSNKNICFLYSLLLLNSTLPAIGALPFVLYWILKNGKCDNFYKFKLLDVKKSIINALTFQNIVGALAVGIVSCFYLKANVSGNHIDSIAPSAASETISLSITQVLYVLFLFIPVDAGIYLLSIWYPNRRKIYFYLVSLCLIIYPFIVIGSSNDFCMRATIPALIILLMLILKTIENPVFRIKMKVCYIILFISLLIGSITPCHEFARTITQTIAGNKKVASELSFNNFFGYVEGNLFLKYFGKVPRN